MRGRIARTVVHVSVLILVAAACTNPPAPGQAASAQPTDQTLTIGVPSIGSTLDINGGVSVGGGSAAGASAVLNYTAGLLKWKVLDEKADNLGSLQDFVPDLAKSYTVTPEGVVFELQPARSPAGNTLSPDDFIFSFKRAIANNASGKVLLTIAGVNIDDPITALGPTTIRLNGKVTPTWPIWAWFYYYAPLDSKVVKEHVTASDPWAKEWLATSYPTYAPYMIESFTPLQRITLTRNPNYFGSKPGYAKVVLTPLGGQPASALLAANSVQVVGAPPLVDFQQMTKNSSLKTVAAPTVSQETIRLSQAFKPFTDPKVRAALSLAIDRNAIVQGPYFGVGAPARSVVSASLLNASATAAAYRGGGEFYAFDLAKAKQLLASSAYPDGFSFTLTINQAGLNSGVDGQAVAVNVQSMLKALNITVTIAVESNAATYQANLAANKLEATYWSETPLPPDLAWSLFNAHTNRPGRPLTNGEKDPVVDELVLAAVQAPIGADRDAKALKAVEQWDGQMWDTPLVDTKLPLASTKAVCGLGPLQALVVNSVNLRPCQ